MTVTGWQGEGRNCVANLVRHVLIENGLAVDMGVIPFVEYEVAADVMRDSRVTIRIVEEKENSERT